MKQTAKIAPYVHDLWYLARTADLPVSEDKAKLLETISTFHMAARYPDVKFEFHKKYNNREIVETWIRHTESLLQWLEEEFQKK